MRSWLGRVPGGVVALTAELSVVAANEIAAGLVGRQPEDLVGQPFETLLTRSARLLFQTHVYPALLTNGRVEEVFLTLEGADEVVPILLNAERVNDVVPGGADAAYVALMIRIRARAQWEQDLLAATRALEEERATSRLLAADLATSVSELEARYANEQRTREFRDAFVGVVSHELRTPITTIYGMSQVLVRRHASMEGPALQARLEDIVAEADRLRRLTEDLLVLSRAEGGRLEIAVEPLLMGHLVRSVVRTEQDRVPDRRFELAIQPSLPLVHGEPTYVEQVLRNFLSNAVKYGPTGSTVRISVQEQRGGVATRVTDEGPGFGSDAPEQLWELFYRTQRAIRQTAGAGIGLFVSRALIEGMGGEVWARPATQPATGGAEFGFWLPAAAEPDEE